MKVVDFLKLDLSALKGKIICFPTDTVYGVGCMIDDEEALDKIYHLKHRDNNKPLACLTPSIEAINDYVLPYNQNCQALMDKYWPGGLTIIFNKKPNVSDYLTKGLKTIGLRMPNSEVALSVLNKCGLMATTSVNISGYLPLNDLKEIQALFKDDIDIYIEDEQEISGISSTIVDGTKDEIVVLREGSIKIK